VFAHLVFLLWWTCAVDALKRGKCEGTYEIWTTSMFIENDCRDGLCVANSGNGSYAGHRSNRNTSSEIRSLTEFNWERRARRDFEQFERGDAQGATRDAGPHRKA
jgi:hypothetical protein